MTLSHECKSRHIKQVPLKPTHRRGKISGASTPGPNKYIPPAIIGGSGYNKIKRAPAYTFGQRTTLNLSKPVTTPYAPLYNVENFGRTGYYKVTHGIVAAHYDPISDKSKNPGPAAYKPNANIQYKQPPKYSLQPAARPPRKALDMWTPSPNMYWPDIACKKPPAFSIGSMAKDMKPAAMPGPGDHNPNFDYVRKSKPAFSISGRLDSVLKPTSWSPPPNIYCEKKFMYTKPCSPASSFGICHSRFIGQAKVFLKSSKLNLDTEKIE